MNTDRAYKAFVVTMLLCILKFYAVNVVFGLFDWIPIAEFLAYTSHLLTQKSFRIYAPPYISTPEYKPTKHLLTNLCKPKLLYTI